MPTGGKEEAAEFNSEGLECRRLSLMNLASPDANPQDPLHRAEARISAPSQLRTLVESKRGGFAASHRDATTLAVSAKMLRLT
jgi:hypothetical protein